MLLAPAARALVPVAVLALCCASTALAQTSLLPPDHIAVRPVFFVPSDQQPPTADQQARLLRHLDWARQRYSALLLGRDTFTIAAEGVLVHRGAQTLADYLQRPEDAAPDFVAELLGVLRQNRFNCPYVLLVVLINPDSNRPAGGGRPLNGGLNTGGGVVVLSSWALDHYAPFQCTLQHELGHAFGLLHADAYGFEMSSHASLMSYNPAHHTNGFAPSRTPGAFCPEDLRALALNHRAFPRFVYVLRRDLPAGYPLRPGPRWLPPMTIPGQAAYRFVVSTTSGEAEGSRVANLAVGVIRPDRRPQITYDASTMWHSPALPDGWATLEIRFAEPVTLDWLALHTEHSGLYHRAQAVTVEMATGRGWRAVTRQALRQADADVRFAQATAAIWRLRLQAGPSRMIVVRGLRWFWQEREVCPPLLAPEAFG